MKKQIKVILVADGLIMLAGALLGPIYAIFVEEIGGDILTAGTAWAIFSIVAGIVVLIFGKIGDKVKSKKKLISIGYLIMGIGFLSYLLVDNITKLFIVQIIIGIGEAMHAPSLEAAFSKHTEDKNGAFLWGAWGSLYYIVGGLGALLGAAIAQSLGFPPLFVLMGSLAIISAVYLFILPNKIFE